MIIVQEGRQEVAEYAMSWAQAKLESGRSQPVTGSQTVKSKPWPGDQRKNLVS